MTTSVDRRGFIRNASSFAAAGVGCLTYGSLGSMLQAAGRAGAHQVLQVPTRPFNILAFGDSIMWGQGLSHNLKFATLVKDWVGANLSGRAVTLQNLAHSGAVIQTDSEDGATGWEGEVPSPYPSISHQLNAARNDRAEIDLVLLNGGANDVKITHILNPLNSSGGVGEVTRDVVGGRMAYLLPMAVSLFPNAKFIVPGYYPIITDDSSTEAVTVLLAILPLGVLALPWHKQQMIANCSAFYAESGAGLKAAVDAQNGRTPNRCVYADPGFSIYNGYGASQRCLFNVAESDPMLNARKAYCTAAGQEFDPLCAGASMGHPNVKGAEKYRDAMTGKLQGFLAEWQGLRKLFACVDPKPVIGVASNYTVWVEDYETRLPVTATVTISAQTFSANTSFSHAFGCGPSETVTSEGTRGKPGGTVTFPGGCEGIGITAPRYIPLGIPTRA
ncbi:MAG: SGNH/GDSL hydrolase family protein [Gemmatimonadales bacterium]